MADHRPASSTPGATVIALLGERWNYLIAREIFFGVHRFSQLKRALGIAPNILATRLGALAEAGIISKERYHVDPDWFEYHLTDHAREALPAMLSLAQWAEEHLESRPLLRALRHTSCGQLTTPILVCNCCGEPVHARDLQPELVARDTSDTTAAKRISKTTPKRKAT